MKKRFIALVGLVGFMGVGKEGGQPVKAQSPLAMVTVTKNPPAAVEKLVFDRVLVYEQTDYNGSVVRYQVLLNSKTGQFGFDRKLANLSFPGVVGGYTFVTGQPDGSYRVYVADKYEGKIIMRFNVGGAYYAPNRAAACRNRFQKRYHPTGREGSQYGLTAAEYKASLGRSDTEWLWVAEVPFNSYPLYLFNELALEAKPSFIAGAHGGQGSAGGGAAQASEVQFALHEHRSPTAGAVGRANKPNCHLGSGSNRSTIGRLRGG